MSPRRAPAAPKDRPATALRMLPQQYEPAYPIDKLKAFPGNPKDHDLGAITESMQRNGFAGAVIVQKSTGRILSGHGTTETARIQGATTVPAIIIDCDAATAKRLLLVFNRSVELGGYHEEALADFLKEMGDLAGTGFDAEDLDRLMASVNGFSTVAADTSDLKVPTKPKSKRGIVYRLGPHRVLCGDARSATDLEKLLAAGGGVSVIPEVLWTDPPYGVSYVGKTKEAKTIQSDGEEGLQELLRQSFATINAVLAPSARIYCASPTGKNSLVFRQEFIGAGWWYHQELIWVKNSLVLGHSDYHSQHEAILYGWQPGPGRPGRGLHDGTRWYGDNAQTSVLQYDRPSRSEEHPTMKPPPLIQHCLHNSSRRGDAVLDAFAGSGSTMVACHASGRVAYLLEDDPAYVDVIRARYATMVSDQSLMP